MKETTQILIISDLHTNTETVDEILNRFISMAQVIAIDEMTIGNLIVVCAGDIVYSGKGLEYSDVDAIIESFTEEVQKRCPKTPIEFIFAPGNHDSELEKNKKLFENYLKKPGKIEEEVSQECIERENEFFKFESKYGKNQSLGNRINWIREVKCTENNSIIFNVINSSAYVYLGQEKGTLHFEIAKLTPVKSTKSNPVITVMHHPLSWFEDTIRMELIRYLRENTSILVTGHEHTGDEFTEIHDKKKVIHIESAQCHEKNQNNSEITSAYIEWQEVGPPIFRQHVYIWNGNDYVKKCDVPDEVIETRDCMREYEFSEFAHTWLNALPSGLRHPKIGELSFDDVYIDRRLRYHKVRGGTFEVIDSDDVLEQSNKHCIIFGDTSSGKTTLAINYVRKLFMGGKVPLYIDASKDFGKKSLVEVLNNNLIRYYEKRKSEQYLKVSPENRAIIIDNFERLHLNCYNKKDVLQNLSEQFDAVIIFVNETGFFEIASDAEINAIINDNYRVYQLLEMSPKAIDSIVHKWNMLSNNFDLSPRELEDMTLKIEDKLRHLTGENIVPRYPVYILLFLCAMSNERNNVRSTQIGSYGSLYEIVIKERLFNVASPKFDLQTLSSVLEHIAYKLFENRKREMDEDLYQNIIKDFNDSHGTSFSNAKIMNLFLDSGILIEKSKGMDKLEYSFAHDYYYYYYVAKYLSGNLSYPEVKKTVEELCNDFYINENVNIWLFLTHLSRDPFLIDTIVNCADAQLSDCKEIMFDNDISFIEQLRRERKNKLMFVDKDYSTAKRERLAREESLYERRKFQDDASVPAVSESDSDVGTKLTIAIKTIDVLGQFLRNFTGPLLATEKQRLLIASYNLSLRTIDFIISIFKVEADDFIQYVESRAKFKHQMDEDKAIQEFSNIFYDMLMWFSYLVLNKTATAVSHEHLLSPYESVRQSMLSRVLPGQNMNSLELLHLFVMMYSKPDIVTLFTTDAWEAVSSKPFCEGIFKRAALNFCYTHPVDRTDKERVCSYLKVSYKAMIMKPRS